VSKKWRVARRKWLVTNGWWLVFLATGHLPLLTSAFGQTPTLVQVKTDANLTNGTSMTHNNAFLPDVTPANNLLVAACTWGSGSGTITVTDDKSNTWTNGPVRNGSSGQSLQLAFAPGVASGTQKINVTFPAATGFNGCQFYEFFNVATSAPGDGSCNNEVSVAAVACGNITTTQANDLIIQASVCNSCSTSTQLGSWTAGASFNLLATDSAGEFMGSQYRVVASASTVNPTMTLSPTPTFAITVAQAFKNATAGSDLPAGIRVRSLQISNVPGGADTTFDSTSYTLQFPTRGNLVVAGYGGVPGVGCSTISSSPANTWTLDGNPSFSSAQVCMWHAQNATTSTNMTITFGLGTAPSGSTNVTLWAWDVSGAATSGVLDVSNTATGTAAFSAGTVTNAPSLTTTGANELVLGLIQEDSETVTSVAPGVMQAVLPPDAYEAFFYDQDGGWQNYYAASAGAVNLSWTYSAIESGSPNVGGWAAVAAAFKAPAAGGGPPKLPIVGVGASLQPDPSWLLIPPCSDGSCTLIMRFCKPDSGKQPHCIDLATGANALTLQPIVRAKATGLVNIFPAVPLSISLTLGQ